MKRLMILLLALVLLCGCQTNPGVTEPSTVPTVPTTQPVTTPATTQPTTEPATEPATEPVTEPATEPVVLYRNPLTGEALEEPVTKRPYAMVINNIRAAQPLHGIGQADMLFEIVAEGGGSITRCVALYHDPAGVEKIGSIRSARTYLIDIARAYDAIFVHAGWSEYAQDLLGKSHWPFLNGLFGDAGSYFYRDRDRINAGYSLEHTYFTTGNGVIEYAQAKKYRTDSKFDSYGLTFTADGTPAGKEASSITLSFYKNGKGTRMDYDAQDGCYYGTQLWSSHTGEFLDANTDVKVPFENVVILYARTTTDGYRMFADLVGSGKGYFACGGKIVPILWSRNTETAPFVYTLEDGTPVELGIGKTYVGIIPKGSPVEYK
jgi:hypothetical protein